MKISHVLILGLILFVSVWLATNVKHNEDTGISVQAARSPSDVSVMLFEDEEFATLTSDTSAWFKISKYEKFTLFVQTKTDSDNYSASGLGDSLNALVKYELHFGTSLPSTTSNGYWQDGQSAPLTVLTLTIADTANGGRFEKQFSPDPAAWMRAIVTKSTGHVLSSGKIKYDLGLHLDAI